MVQAPGLAVVIVGDRQDSQTYVNMKQKACEEVGIKSFDARLPASVSQQELLSVVRGFNENPDVHGILVQLPVRCFYSCMDFLSLGSLSQGFCSLLFAGCSCLHRLMSQRSWVPSASTRTLTGSIR